MSAIRAMMWTGVLFVSSTADVTANDSDLDLGYGDSGIDWAKAPSPNRFWSPNASTLDAYGRLLTVSDSTDVGGIIRRTLPDGGPDPTFGVDGIARLETPSAWGVKYVKAVDVVARRNGLILVLFQLQWTSTDTDFALAQFQDDGSLDPNFGYEGISYYWFDLGLKTDRDIPVAMVLDSEERTAIIGTVDVPNDPRFVGDTTDLGVVRVRVDGSLDPSFGDGGRQVVGIEAGASGAQQCGKQPPTQQPRDEAGAIAVVPGGGYALGATTVREYYKKLGAGGSCYLFRNTDFALARLKTDGAFDEAFDSDGMVKIAIDAGGSNDDILRDIVFMDERIVAVGESTTKAGPFGERHTAGSLVRLDWSGALDQNFGNRGKKLLRFVSTTDHEYSALFSAVVGPQRELVVVGRAGDSVSASDSDVGVAALQWNGAEDIGFGSEGTGTMRIKAGPWSRAQAVHVQPGTGALLVSATSDDGVYTYMTSMRLRY